jgi:hypothetical protein
VAVGLPRTLEIELGLAYVFNSIHFDPLTLATIAVAMVVGWRMNLATRLEAVGLALTLVYVVWVGGDFMSGRFFTLAFLLASLIVVSSLDNPRVVAYLFAGLMVYNVLIPTVPIKTTASYNMAWPWRTQHGIKDERGGYHQLTNILFYDPLRELPDHVWVRQGKSDRDSPAHVFEEGSIGYVGYYAGPHAYIIDTNALGDPFLSRLPVSEAIYFDFNISHYYRPIPAGYVASRQSGKDELTDPVFRDFFDRLTDITSGPIFSWRRFENIYLFNVGRYRNFHDLARREQSLDIGVGALNPQFSTAVGRADRENGSLQTTGQSGYLELGPRIPMSTGVYTVRWYGAVRSAPAASRIGFVKACYDDCRHTLAVADVFAPTPARADRLITEMTFRVPRDVEDLEYRFFVDAATDLDLEHIRLTSDRRTIPQG